MRFTPQQDYNTILKINKELINTVIDTPIIIYKLHIENTKINLYGEGTSKFYYKGVAVPCLIKRDDANPINETGTIDFEQIITFAFLREELKTRDVYPETGDVIEFDMQYYEVNNANEVQLYAEQVSYIHQVYCEAHLMRKVPLQLEKPIV